MPNVPRTHDNIRIERGDYEFGVDDVPLAVGRAVPSQVLTRGSRWILSGFDVTTTGFTAEMTVSRGVGLLSTREKGQVLTGVVSFEGDASKTLDLTAYAVGVYGVWVRAEMVDSDFQNRIFWNPSTQSEFTQSVATRRSANWSVRVEPTLTNPGAEWLRIADVEVDVLGPPLILTDRRNLFFEGDVANAHAATFHDGTVVRVWGSVANDRDAARQTYGVKDLQTFTAAMRVQLEGIIGDRWWTAVAEPLDQKVSRAGDATLSGSYVPTFDDGYTLGSAAFKWSDIYTNFLHAGQIRRQPAILTADVGTSAARFRKLWFESGDFSAGLTAFGPISFGSTLTTDGNILTSSATRDLGAVTSAATRWNVFANTLDVLSTSTFTGAATFTSQPRVPKPAPVAKLTTTTVANSVQQQSTAAAWCRISKPAATAYVSGHALRVHNIALNPVVTGGGVVLQFDFLHAMANTDYIVVITSGGTTSPHIGKVTARTTTSFSISVDDWSGALFQNIDFNQVGGSPSVDLNVVVFGDAA